VKYVSVVVERLAQLVRMYMLLCIVKSVQYTLVDVGLVSAVILPQHTGVATFLKAFCFDHKVQNASIIIA
jgi:hypothetical protein